MAVLVFVVWGIVLIESILLIVACWGVFTKYSNMTWSKIQKEYDFYKKKMESFSSITKDNVKYTSWNNTGTKRCRCPYELSELSVLNCKLKCENDERCKFVQTGFQIEGGACSMFDYPYSEDCSGKTNSIDCQNVCIPGQQVFGWEYGVDDFEQDDGFGYNDTYVKLSSINPNFSNDVVSTKKMESFFTEDRTDITEEEMNEFLEDAKKENVFYKADDADSDAESDADSSSITEEEFEKPFVLNEAHKRF